MKRRPKSALTIEETPVQAKLQSFRVTDSGVFQKGDLRISRGGLHQEQKEQDVAFALSDLQIGDILGKGASGDVRFALLPATGLKIALKDIDVFDEKRRQQVIPELTVLLRTSHPNLVRLYDAFFDQGKIYMALEFMDAGTVDALCKRFHKIPEPVLASFMQQTLMGLAYLHEDCKQVHRDMKPENLLVKSDGFIKIADFGISKQVGAEQRGAVSTFVGTALYMSPERLNSESYSYPADVWAVGIIAYECGVGEHPYSTGTTSYFELLPKIVTGPDPIPPKEGFSTDFRDFVRMCVQKDPQNRPTADQMLQHPFILNNASDHPEAIVSQWLSSGGVAVPVPRLSDHRISPVVASGEFHSLRESFKRSSGGAAVQIDRFGTTSSPQLECKSRTLADVSSYLGCHGVTQLRLMFAIDFTKSNKFSGTNTFEDRSLHWLDPEEDEANPYQWVMSVLGRTLHPLQDDTNVHAFGFGDEVSKDSTFFRFFEDGEPRALQATLNRYKEILGTVQMSGGTNFGPVIMEAIEVIKKSGSDKFHLLVIIADGCVTSLADTKAALAEAAKYPLTILVVGVGDGPFEDMAILTDGGISNLCFVEHYEVVVQNSDRPDAGFASECVAHLPEHLNQMRTRGLLK